MVKLEPEELQINQITTIDFAHLTHLGTRSWRKSQSSSIKATTIVDAVSSPTVNTPRKAVDKPKAKARAKPPASRVTKTVVKRGRIAAKHSSLQPAENAPVIKTEVLHETGATKERKYEATEYGNKLVKRRKPLASIENIQQTASPNGKAVEVEPTLSPDVHLLREDSLSRSSEAPEPESHSCEVEAGPLIAFAPPSYPTYTLAAESCIEQPEAFQLGYPCDMSWLEERNVSIDQSSPTSPCPERVLNAVEPLFPPTCQALYPVLKDTLVKLVYCDSLCELCSRMQCILTQTEEAALEFAKRVLFLHCNAPSTKESLAEAAFRRLYLPEISRKPTMWHNLHGESFVSLLQIVIKMQERWWFEAEGIVQDIEGLRMYLDGVSQCLQTQANIRVTDSPPPLFLDGRNAYGEAVNHWDATLKDDMLRTAMREPVTDTYLCDLASDDAKFNPFD